MELFVLGLFCITLSCCILFGFPLLGALVIGYIIFFSFGIYRKFTVRQMLGMSWNGIRTTRNILILFVMIGALTASWRSSGTVASIIYYSIGFLRPSIMLLMAFLLNALVSVLTGTSFGTSATMGVICMTMALSMGVNPVLAGGAILSGAYFGDRCSPVSTSALLVSEVTGTDIFSNIKGMIRTSIVPFVLTCLIYLAFGIMEAHTSTADLSIRNIFSTQFHLGLFPLLPAILIFGLAIAKVPVKKAMICSLTVSILVDCLYQGTSVSRMIHTLIFGYASDSEQLASMLNGGGLTSMIRVASIVCLSSCYSGIFEGTGLLLPLKEKIAGMRKHLSAFACIFFTSIASSLIACNQTLSILLTNQLCGFLVHDPEHPAESASKMALSLENTAVVIAPLVPWCIAGAVPLSTVGAPMLSLVAACYLYLVPLWNLAVNRNRKR